MFQRDPDAPAVHLTERDIRILEALYTHRFLSMAQLQALVFQTQSAVVQRRLRKLFDAGLIDRIQLLPHANRGIPPLAYVLTPSGANTLGIASGPVSARNAKLRWLHHRYLVNQFYIQLVVATRTTPVTLYRWLHEEDLKVPNPSGLPRAESIQVGGRRQPFLPDGLFQLESGKGITSFFLEVDLSTEPQSVWRRRAHIYQAYHRSGKFLKRFGEDQRRNFRVALLCLPDFRGRSRLDNILATVRQAIGNNDMFIGTTLPDCQPDTILGPVWRGIRGTTVELAETGRKRVAIRSRSMASK